MARYALAGALATFCTALLLVRFLVFPNLESQRETIAQALARGIGQPVSLEALATGWDGWNPRVTLSGVRIGTAPDGSAGLVVPKLRLVLAWTSLVFLDLRFKDVYVENPQLAIRRDEHGMLHVAGMAMDPAARGEDTRLADWFLRQPRIEVRDALITWLDEERRAPQLLLDHVDFRLENLFGRHRFGLRGSPPSALASPLDLRGDVTGTSLHDWRAFSGKLYARLDYADIHAWREWIPFAVPLEHGEGGVRAWFTFTDGQAREMITDVVLADVDGRLRPDLPEFALSHLEGRMGWREDEGRREIFTERLSFVDKTGVLVPPTDARVVMRVAADGRTEAVSVTFNQLELEPLRRFGAQFPLPEEWRDALARHAPRGTISDGSVAWDGAVDKPSTYRASARFSGLGISAYERLPGFTNLTGTFEADQDSGRVVLQGKTVSLDLPQVFASTLRFDTARARVRWSRAGAAIIVSVDDAAVANADAAGTLTAEYRTLPEGPGFLNANARFTRADAKGLPRYLPFRLRPHAREWIEKSVVAGTSDDLRIKLEGNLADFPFADARKGQFLLTANTQNVTLDYAPGWPRLTDIEGEVRVDNSRLTIDGKKGRALGAALSRVHGEIADMRAEHPTLVIAGDAAGATGEFLRFIDESPVAGWTEHFTSGIKAEGDGRLALKLELALNEPARNRIDGAYTMVSNQVLLGGGIPPLSNVGGTLNFSERELQATALTAEILGGPARVSLATEEGHVRVNGQGSANLALLGGAFPHYPFVDRVSGTTDWQIVVRARAGQSTWSIDAPLTRASVDMPAPVGKKPGETLALHVERQAVDASRDTISIRYGRVGRVVLSRRLADGEAVTDRVLVALGGAEGEPTERGLWVRGEAPALALDDWLALGHSRLGGGTGPPEETLALMGADVHVGALDAWGRRLNDARIRARRAGGDWRLDVAAHELAGSLTWSAVTSAQPNGRVVARLERFSIPASTREGIVAPGSPGDPDASAAWPALDIASEHFMRKERDLGRLQVLAKPKGADWQIERLSLANDDGTLTASGLWQTRRDLQQTRVDVDLDVRDAGRYLERFDMPNAIRGGPTRIKGDLAWSGGPAEFDYATLNGSFHVETGAGQFVKLDPGLGKLLGVLSLQSLRRRLAFDFQDVFGEGFAFDEINGDVAVKKGVMTSSNLRIAGPAARVAISGVADLERETQTLTVRVQPALSAGVSVAATAILLANPLIGAAVGAGSLLAQKVLQDPIEKIFSYEYAVTGTWSDPLVERVGGLPRLTAAPAAVKP